MESKNMLLAVMVINYYVLMINLVRLFKSHLGENVICHVINIILEESKYRSKVMKKYFSKDLKNKKYD